MDEVKVNSTKDSLVEFIDSIIWDDIKRELEAWKKGFQIETDSIVEEAATTNPSTAAVLLHLGDLNGRQKAVDYMLQLPELLLSLAEERDENKSV